MPARTKSHDFGPIRVVVACTQASDGLIYDVLDCQHRVLTVGGQFSRVAVGRRHCPRCQRRPPTPCARDA
jgi:hypothetical protein